MQAARRSRWNVMVTALLAAAGVLGVAGPAGAQTPPPSVVRPGAPGEATVRLTADDLRVPTEAMHTEADVTFMRNMILHHRQALVMSGLALERTDRADIRLLARRIDLSQDAEIALMTRWLELRGESAPDAADEHAHHADHHDHDADGGRLMAGMLTEAQLAALAAAEGPAFDRLFLELMIYHHDGALEMVAELFASPGAARDSDVFDFASHVVSDQRMEIARMRRMLDANR